MAADAEIRLVGSGKEPRRADRKEQEQEYRAASGDDERKDGPAGFEHIHNVTSLAGRYQAAGRPSKLHSAQMELSRLQEKATCFRKAR
jgi:hypothetical protein